MAKLISALLLAPALFGAKSEIDDPSQQLTLRLYNYAEVPDPILRRAKREAERVFARIEIEIDWRDCPTSPEQIPSNRACSGKLGPGHLILNVLPKAMSKRYGFKSGVYGFALPTAKGVPGNSISLFFERVLDLAFYGGVGASFEGAQAIILGHMIAHEVGHLLLGPESHSRTGIMSFPWDARTLTLMERGRLEFTSQQHSKIHEELRRRNASGHGNSPGSGPPKSPSGGG